jgi:ribose transport system permease protein
MTRTVPRNLGELLPLVLLAGAFAAFGVLSCRFLETANLVNILVQSSSVAIVAIGMTLVLLTGGIDLSVGSIMFLAAAVAGKMVLASNPMPVWLGVAAILPLGILFGAVNALFIAKLRLMPFIVTLATLYVGRGLALAITQTRAMNLPDDFLRIGQSRLLGIPFPIVLLVIVAVSAHALLTQTPFGRQLYALGHDAEAARKAGIRVRGLTAAVYVLSGLCAALGGIVSVAQLGAVSPTFGYQREFAAIAAAVLGGTSLFGGRGSVLPGTVVGAVLIQTIEDGLVIVNANPYAYPVVTAAVIFIAVLSDRLRTLGRPGAAAYST